MMPKWEKFSTRNLADLVLEAHKGVFGTEKRVYHMPRETVIAELERCIEISRLKERVA
jgi:hypothetical protein